MNSDTLRLWQISTGITLLGATPVLLGWADPMFLIGVIALAVTPFLFLGTISGGRNADELLDADDAWGYESPSNAQLDDKP